MDDPFYFQSYRNRLSNFGQKVLQVLIKQWRDEKARNNIIHQQPDLRQLKRHLIESSKHSDSFEPNFANNTRKKCTLQFLEKETPIASTPYELLNYKPTEEKSLKRFACRDDLVNSAVAPIKESDFKSPDSDTFDVNAISMIDLKSPSVSPNDIIDVSWSNMFDAEIFPDDSDVSNKQHNIINQNQSTTVHTNVSSVEIPCESEFKKPDIKVTKRKNSMKQGEPILKKEKKLTKSNTKSIPRKENYTKVVKNWLNDVEKNSLLNIVDSNSCLINETISTPMKENVDADKICPKPITKKKSVKRVVQAELANKDGKMKFGKPKKNVDDGKEEIAANINLPLDIKSDKEKNKEKKNKSKFVIPIKSQTPVKDLTYKIFTVDTNTEEISSLKEITSSEIHTVLVYRNGFNQLNCNYTDDTCIPEGIMIHTNDNFYYFKTFDKNNIGLIIQNILGDNTSVCYEGKSILIFLSRFDIKINSPQIRDAKIGGALLDPDNPPESFSSLQKLVSHTAEYTISTDCPLQKAAWYMTLLKETAQRLEDLLIKNSLWNIFVDVEMRLLPIVADMERRGVCVDVEKLISMENILVTKLKKVEQECHKAAGRQFQVNSPLQLRALLYDELKLDAKCNVKIRETLAKGAKSTSESTLRSLMSVHPLPKLILEYRHLHKAHATFLAGIAQHVKDGIVKPTWVQTAAATGRIASNNPNLQAIPKAPFSLIMFPESEDVDNPVLNFRSVYVSRAGYSLLAADFKHVECRVFAHAAADTALLDALQSEQDLFKLLAAKWLNKIEEEISEADRERTKRIIYASLYGAGARKLMDILDMSYEQTLSVMASFHRTFPSLKSFGRSVVSQCETRGGRLSTLCGRVRTFSNITSQDFAARSHAERQAVNYIVQGSAADLCKMAMILTEERLRGSSPPLRAHLVLQIHDELVWEVHDHDLERAAGAVKEAMEGCARRCGLALRLPVALARGRSWGSLAPVQHTLTTTQP